MRDKMKQETIIKEYGARSGMINNRYGIHLDGHLVTGRTFKNFDTARVKALEFAQRVHKDFYQSFNDTYYHFEFKESNITGY
jgi:hypothetical protein